MNRDIMRTSIVGFIVVLIIILTLSLITTNQIDAITSFQCCGGNDCSDTYYTAEDNQCHLVLCESSAFTNKGDCTYDGANETLVWLE